MGIIFGCCESSNKIADDRVSRNSSIIPIQKQIPLTDNQIQEKSIEKREKEPEKPEIITTALTPNEKLQNIKQSIMLIDNVDSKIKNEKEGKLFNYLKEQELKYIEHQNKKLQDKKLIQERIEAEKKLKEENEIKTRNMKKELIQQQQIEKKLQQDKESQVKKEARDDIRKEHRKLKKGFSPDKESSTSENDKTSPENDNLFIKEKDIEITPLEQII